MSHTVLLVDDEPHICTGLQRALHKEPYTILSASSVDAAQALFQQHTVDVVVADQDMPGMPGTAFLAGVRQAFPETIRLILTGKATPEVVRQAIHEAAVSHFFTKPCNSAVLAFVLRQVLQQKDVLTEARDLLALRQDDRLQLATWARTYPRIMPVRGPQDGERPAAVDECPLAALMPLLARRAAKAVLVVSPRSRSLIRATLHAVEGTTVTLDLPLSVVHCKRGERFLVLCAVPAQERYILQGWVQDVYYQRLVLQCQAPDTTAQ